MSKTKWSIDPAHSQIQFSVRHMVISKIRGEFEQFESWLETDGEEIEGGEAFFSAVSSTINTGNKMRDDHLRSGEFFKSEEFPNLTFKSTSIEKKNDEDYVLKGNMTMRGVTKPLELDVEFGGVITDPYGLRRAGFSITGQLNRKDYGMTYNDLIETGGAVAGDKIKLDLHVEFTYKPEEA